MPAKRKRGPGQSLAEDSIENGNVDTNQVTRPLAQAQSASAARRLCRQRHTARMWRLGDRVLFELVDHIVEVDDLRDRFAGLDPAVLRVPGGGKLLPSPIHEVRR